MGNISSVKTNHQSRYMCRCAL